MISFYIRYGSRHPSIGNQRIIVSTYQAIITEIPEPDLNYEEVGILNKPQSGSKSGSKSNKANIYSASLASISSPDDDDKKLIYFVISRIQGLNPGERSIARTIAGLDNEYHCIATNETIEQVLGISWKTRLRGIRKLEQIGLVIREIHRGPIKYGTSRVLKMSKEFVKKWIQSNNQEYQQVKSTGSPKMTLPKENNPEYQQVKSTGGPKLGGRGVPNWEGIYYKNIKRWEEGEPTSTKQSLDESLIDAPVVRKSLKHKSSVEPLDEISSEEPVCISSEGNLSQGGHNLSKSSVVNSICCAPQIDLIKKMDNPPGLIASVECRANMKEPQMPYEMFSLNGICYRVEFTWPDYYEYIQGIVDNNGLDDETEAYRDILNDRANDRKERVLKRIEKRDKKKSQSKIRKSGLVKLKHPELVTYIQARLKVSKFYIGADASWNSGNYDRCSAQAIEFCDLYKSHYGFESPEEVIDRIIENLEHWKDIRGPISSKMSDPRMFSDWLPGFLNKKIKKERKRDIPAGAQPIDKDISDLAKVFELVCQQSSFFASSPIVQDDLIEAARLTTDFFNQYKSLLPVTKPYQLVKMIVSVPEDWNNFDNPGTYLLKNKKMYSQWLPQYLDIKVVTGDD